MAHTNEAPESRTLLLRRIAQLEDDLAETRGCIVRLASVIETLLIDGPQPVLEEPDSRDDADWLAPVIPLEPGRPRREDAPPGQERASRPLPPARRGGDPAHAHECGGFLGLDRVLDVVRHTGAETPAISGMIAPPSR